MAQKYSFYSDLAQRVEMIRKHILSLLIILILFSIWLVFFKTVIFLGLMSRITLVVSIVFIIIKALQIGFELGRKEMLEITITAMHEQIVESIGCTSDEAWECIYDNSKVEYYINKYRDGNECDNKD